MSLLQTVVQIAKLAKVGVRFLAAEQVLDTEGWTCSQWDILRAAAEFERQASSEKVKVGMTAAKRQGKRIGQPRLSFDRQKARILLLSSATRRSHGQCGVSRVFVTYGGVGLSDGVCRLAVADCENSTGLREAVGDAPALPCLQGNHVA